MLVYRSATEPLRSSEVLAGVRRAACGTGSEIAPVRDALVELGRLESAVLDGARAGADEWTPLARAFRRALRSVARLFESQRCEPGTPPGLVRDILAALGELTVFDLPASASAGVPEGYAWYALYPESYAAAAHRLARLRPPSRALVIGIRGIGTSLSAVVEAALEGCGWSVTSCTVRPVGHPYERRVELAPSMEERWLGARGGPVIVVDEGPGASGSSFASVAERAVELGFAARDIVFLCSHEPDPARFVSERARDVWARHFSIAARFEDWWDEGAPIASAFDCGPLLDLSAGAWRRVAYGDPASYPAIEPRHERRKYMTTLQGAAPGSSVMLRFAGLGARGAAAHERARRLERARHGPAVIGCHEGFLGTHFAPGRPMRPGEAGYEFLDVAARYLGFVRAEFPAARATPLAELEEMVLVNVREGVGEPWADRLEPVLSRFAHDAQGASPVALDNRMRPHEWQRNAAGGWFKTDGVEHHDDHFFPGAADIAWDLAALAVEFGLDADRETFLLARYGERTGEPVDASRFTFHRLSYLAFRLGYTRLAAQALGGTAEARRHGRLARRYRGLLAGAIARSAPATARSKPPTAPRVIVFDADDTLRRTTVAGQPCPRGPGEWELLPGVREVLGRMAWGPGGTRLGIASNQDQVGYGLISERTARDLIEQMVTAAFGSVPEGSSLHICPHVPEDGCTCRKPEPGLLLRILDHARVAPAEALFVGNADSDREAARRAHVPYLDAAEFFGGRGAAERDR